MKIKCIIHEIDDGPTLLVLRRVPPVVQDDVEHLDDVQRDLDVPSFVGNCFELGEHVGGDEVGGLVLVNCILLCKPVQVYGVDFEAIRLENDAPESSASCKLLLMELLHDTHDLEAFPEIAARFNGILAVFVTVSHQPQHGALSLGLLARVQLRCCENQLAELVVMVLQVVHWLEWAHVLEDGWRDLLFGGHLQIFYFRYCCYYVRKNTKVYFI